MSIVDMLKEHGLEMGHSVRVPKRKTEMRSWVGYSTLSVSGGDDVVTIKVFQSLVGSLVWISRCKSVKTDSSTNHGRLLIGEEDCAVYV